MTTKIKNGFTLAEILITLAIIGVVAAMTLPTLIQKHQKKVLATKFQQSLSILSQGFQKMMADEEVTDFKDTEWYKKCHDKYLYTKPENSSKPTYGCAEIAKKYFKVVKIVGGEEAYNIMDQFRNASNSDKIKYAYHRKTPSSTNPGNMFFFGTGGMIILSNGMIFNSSNVFIDTNGNAGPNEVGYDVFQSNVLDNGIAVPRYLNRDDEIRMEMVEMRRIREEECPQLGDDAIYCEEDMDNAINDIETELAKSWKERCVEGRTYCGAYLYRNGFVMDY